MKIVEIIKSNKELSELPFLLVFTVMRILSDMNMLKIPGGDADVG